LCSVPLGAVGPIDKNITLGKSPGQTLLN